MVARVEYFETSSWSKSKEFQNYLAIYSSSCCQKFASHRRLICLDFQWNLNKKTRVIAAFFDKPRHLLRNVLKPLLLYKCWPRFFLFFSCSSKETKDLETSSIVSSTAYSWRGKLALERNSPSLNLSDQQRQSGREHVTLCFLCDLFKMSWIL